MFERIGRHTLTEVSPGTQVIKTIFVLADYEFEESRQAMIRCGDIPFAFGSKVIFNIVDGIARGGSAFAIDSRDEFLTEDFVVFLKRAVFHNNVIVILCYPVDDVSGLVRVPLGPKFTESSDAVISDGDSIGAHELALD